MKALNNNELNELKGGAVNVSIGGGSKPRDVNNNNLVDFCNCNYKNLSVVNNNNSTSTCKCSCI